MKRLLRNLFCGVGFCLLWLAFAEAQEVGLIAHIDGGQAAPAIGPIFSNCGPTCSTYDSQEAWYVSGTGFSSGDGGGLTIAVAFKTKKAASFTKALTPLLIITQNGGVNHGKVTGMLLKDKSGVPGAPIATLVQVGTIKAQPNWTVIEYKPKKPIPLKAKTQYWLCLEEPIKDVQAGWAVNSTGDNTFPYSNFAASCKAAMQNAGQGPAPAFAVF